MLPFLWVKNVEPGARSISFKEPVRVISTTCKECGSSKSTAAIMRCKEHLRGTCQNHICIEESDALPFQQGMVFTSVWRTCNEPVAELNLISSVVNEMLMEIKKEKEITHSFEADEYGNFGTISDFAPKIEQNIHHTVVHGDMVTGNKVDIRDSVVKDSNFGNTGPQAEGQKGGKVSVRDASVSDSTLQGDVEIVDAVVKHTNAPKRKDNSRIPKNILEEIGSGKEGDLTPEGLSRYLREIIKKVAQLHNRNIDVKALQEMLTAAREAIGDGELEKAHRTLKDCESAIARYG